MRRSSWVADPTTYKSVRESASLGMPFLDAARNALRSCRACHNTFGPCDAAHRQRKPLCSTNTSGASRDPYPTARTAFCHSLNPSSHPAQRLNQNGKKIEGSRSLLLRTAKKTDPKNIELHTGDSRRLSSRRWHRGMLGTCTAGPHLGRKWAI